MKPLQLFTPLRKVVPDFRRHSGHPVNKRHMKTPFKREVHFPPLIHFSVFLLQVVLE